MYIYLLHLFIHIQAGIPSLLVAFALDVFLCFFFLLFDVAKSFAKYCATHDVRYVNNISLSDIPSTLPNRELAEWRNHA